MVSIKSIRLSTEDTDSLLRYCLVLLSQQNREIDKWSLEDQKNEAGILLGYSGTTGKNIFRPGAKRQTIPHYKFQRFCRKFLETQDLDTSIRDQFKMWQYAIEKLYLGESQIDEIHFSDSDLSINSLSSFTKSIAVLKEYYLNFKGVYLAEAKYFETLQALINRRLSTNENLIDNLDSEAEDQIFNSLLTHGENFLQNLFRKRWIIHTKEDDNIIQQSIDFIKKRQFGRPSPERFNLQNHAYFCRKGIQKLEVDSPSMHGFYEQDKFVFDATQQILIIANSDEERTTHKIVTVFIFDMRQNAKELFWGYHISFENQDCIKFKRATLSKFPKILKDSEYDISLYEVRSITSKFISKEIREMFDNWPSFDYKSFIPIIMDTIDIFYTETPEVSSEEEDGERLN